MRHLLYTLLLAATLIPDSTVAQTPATPDYTKGNNVHEVESQPASSTTSRFSHFTWGADIGSCIDLNGNNMSSVLIDAGFGYKNDFINFAGVGAGINVMLNNGSRLFPVYAMLRTGFRPRPTIAFLDLRAGCSFNNIDNSTSQVGFYGSAGVGFNLASGRTFKSYIIAGYSYTGLQPYTDKSGQSQDHSDINAAVIRLGISF
ncbi:MAG: hypothetical protein NC117_04365 [Pseudoflavonifractor sp.]|nr:hypothetical protein [Pseudoflavonifractor sp.]